MSYSDAEFESLTDEIEELYSDLRGIESVSEAILHRYVEQQTGEAELVAPAPFPYTMPSREPFTVYPVMSSEDEGELTAQLNAVFHAGQAIAPGTGPWLRATVQHLHGVDADALVEAATDQARALVPAYEQFVGDYADVRSYLDDHWSGGSASAFKTLYDDVADKMDQILTGAEAAAVGAGATGDAIKGGQKRMLVVARDGRDVLRAALDSWRDDADGFPFPPGVSDRAMSEFGDLIGQITKYGKLIPVIGKGFKVADIGVQLFGLVGSGTPDVLTTPDRSPDIVERIQQSLEKIATHVRDGLDEVNVDLALQKTELYSDTRDLLMDRLDEPGNLGMQHH